MQDTPELAKTKSQTQATEVNLLNGLSEISADLEKVSAENG